MSRLLIVTALAGLGLGCGPDATGLPPERPVDGIRAIHISRSGLPVDTIIRVGALGGIALDILIEEADGTIRGRLADERVVWGSTFPAVVDGGDQDGTAFMHLRRDGRAKVIAHHGGLRDTVAIEIAQVPVAVRFLADSVLVGLTPDARNVTGAQEFHALHYVAIREDSNGFGMPGSASSPIQYTVSPDAPFTLESTARGDTVTITGTQAGEGTITVQLGESSMPVPVTITDTFGLMRMIETPSGAFRTFPETVRIPVGAAVIFQNETRQAIGINLLRPLTSQTARRPIPMHGRGVRIFTEPGRYDVDWIGPPAVVIVSP
jgi:hypothetical protein